MRFRSLHCAGADETACWFNGRDGDARRADVAFDGDARFHAKFDGTDANAARSDDEFTIGLSTLWRPKLQSK